MRIMRLLSILAGLAVCVLATIPAAAQVFPYPYEYSFSSAGASLVQFDFDLPDTLAAEPGLLHEVLYRDATLTTWMAAPFADLYTTCGSRTESTGISFTPSSGVMEWYLRSETDTAVVTQSPKNSGNTFPPSDYTLANLGADPTGDATGGAGSHLDITQCYATYSDTKLYFRYENAGGGFPTNSGLFTYFIYGIGVLDPNASDSSAYMLVYANVPALFSPGLYKLDLADSSFTQIGNISTSISGNSLYMSCNISDLTSQPGWSEWPPPSGFIGILPASGTQTLTDLTINDLGKTVIYQPKSNLLDFNVNSSPALVNPLVDYVDSGAIVASVTYSDADDNCPVLRQLHLDGFDYNMTACLKTYSTGAQFTVDVPVTESGWHYYSFEFSDGVLTTTTDLDSILVQSFVPGDANGDGIANITDAVFIIQWIFAGGDPPDPLEAADANCDGVANITDAVYLIEYIFNDGPPPCLYVRP